MRLLRCLLVMYGGVMLGFLVVVDRDESGEASEVLRFNVGFMDLKYFDELVAKGDAKQLSGGGFPTSYKVAGKHIKAFLTKPIDEENRKTIIGEGGISFSSFRDGLEGDPNQLGDEEIVFVGAWDMD